MRTLADMTPYLGDIMPYLYDGSSNEWLRRCSVYAMHVFPDGPGQFEIDGVRYPIERRSMFLLRPGQLHAFHVSSSHPIHSYNLYFDLWDRATPASANRFFIYDGVRFPPSTPMAAELPCEEWDSLPAVFPLHAHPGLYDTLLTLAKTFNDSAHYRQEASNSLFYALLIGLYNAVHTPQPNDYRIVRLLARLDEHPERREPVETWSELCGLKRSYFHELFLRETGLTPRAYQHRQLMKRAANLLRESSLSVTAIAERLGYPSIHPFSRHFAAYHGASPRDFRMNVVSPKRRGRIIGGPR